jgi:pimeloyl-ACP methyl ester carboxylesterase
MMKHVEITLGVARHDQSDPIRSRAAEPLSIAATVHMPHSLSNPPIVMFAIPGGGYARGYFDMHFPGHTGYSQVEHHTERGIIVIAIDPLGVGTSSIGDLARISFEDLASTYHATVRQITERLKAGSLTIELAALAEFVTVGIGQSMGGCITILTQARYGTFDAVAPLGYSAIHTVLPQRTRAETTHAIEALQRFADEGAPDTDTIARSSTHIPDWVYPFHWEDVPDDILACDMQGGYPLRKTVPSFGSATLPACALHMMVPGAVAVEAAAIQVPVLIGMGERDVCPNPHAEPAAYTTSRDVSLFIVPRMAHMHNFAGTRRCLWDRLVHWCGAVASERGSIL